MRLQTREAVDKYNWGQCRASKAGGMWRSSVDCSNGHKSAKHEKRQWNIIAGDLGRWKVCAKLMPRLLNIIRKNTPSRWVRTSPSVYKLNQTCFVESSLVMRHGFFSMTRKPITRAISGILRRHWGRKKQDSQSHVDQVLRHEFLEQGQTINQQVYREILWGMRPSVHEKRQELRQEKSWLLQHDNAPAHYAMNIQQLLAEENIVVPKQPPYSADLSLSNFFFSPSSRESRGTYFEDL